MKPKSYTPEQISWLKENYAKLPIEVCAKYMGRSEAGLKAILFKNGIKKANYFEYGDFEPNLNSPELVYLLGFLWADGCVWKNGNKTVSELHIQKTDGEEILKLFNKIGKFRISYQAKKNRKPTMRFSSRHPKFNQFLSDCDYLEKSNLQPVKVLSAISEKMVRYWWRGYFDGDGCLTISSKSRHKSMEISGPFSYKWDFFLNLLNKLKIKGKVIRRRSKTGNNSRVAFYSKKDILSFFNYIYPEEKMDEIGLKRKFNKFIELKNRQ